MFFEDWVVLHSINSLASSYTIQSQVVHQECTLRGHKKTIKSHNKEVPKNTKIHDKEAMNNIRNAQQGGAREH
jgi:hypothetical protein